VLLALGFVCGPGTIVAADGADAGAAPLGAKLDQHPVLAEGLDVAAERQPAAPYCTL
jgi:hypothetical protein